MSKDGMVKATAVYTRALTERARQIHHTSPVATAALGRALAGVSMMGNALKGSGESVTLQIKGDGPLGTILAVSDAEGNVRGYVQDASVELPLRADGKLDVGSAVGHSGTLTVIKDLGLKEPYVGSTELVTGEIAEDLAQYMVESEQIPAAVGLGVLVDTDRTIKAAGGFIVQLMPGAPEELIAKLEDNILCMDQLTTVLDEDGLDAVPAQVLKGMEYDIVMRVPVEYRCSCSRERVAAALESCGAAELEDMAASGENTEVSCQFCDKVYSFTPAELREIAKGKNF